MLAAPLPQRAAVGTGYVKKNATRRLAAIAKLAFDVIPQDPAWAEYRQSGRRLLVERIAAHALDRVEVALALRLSIPSLEFVPNTTPAALLIQMTVLDQVAEMWLQRVSADTRQFDRIANRDSPVLAGKFDDLQ